MTNIEITFEILENDMKTPGGWNMVTGHIIFDVKMDFMRKTIWVLDGHKIPDPAGSSYFGVVSRESTILPEALHNPDVWMRPAICSDGSKHYEYILLYRDEALAIRNIQRSSFVKGL
eukprot:15325270-Ditylum_brightwellii.AAC.1